MASTSAATSNLSISVNLQFKNSTLSFPLSLSFCNPNPRNITGLQFCCRAAKQQSPNQVNKKRKKKSNHTNSGDVYKGFGVNADEIVEDEVENDSQSYQSVPLPKPPAGFVVDDQGKVLMVSNKRIVTIVDSANNFPLDCVIRRVFKSSRGDECMLLCPVDMPVQIMKSTNFEGWSAVSDEEVEAILPTAAYALAKIHMHLIYSGFCYTARGGFCYTEDNIFEFRTDDGEDVDGLPNEGVEITFFNLDGSHYMIYTPSDPLLFVAMKEHIDLIRNIKIQVYFEVDGPRYEEGDVYISAAADHEGHLQIADDELLEDPATISAIDEETEFNALVEEEAALLESLFGER